MIVVLTGGTGGAKFVDGLRQVVPQEELTLIVNTGDDLDWWGLWVSPDLDSITYVLAGVLSKERGWGVTEETFHCLQTMRRMGQPTWFQVGDRDLAMHLTRTKLLAEGNTLTRATAEIAVRLGVKARILPMSDAHVETRILTPLGELSFEEYFVKRRFQDPVEAVLFAGAEEVDPSPEILRAIREANAVLLAPSNPVTSIGPILAVPGIREALRETKSIVAAISPIVGGAPITGPAGVLMESQGWPVSVGGVAQAYRDFLDVLVIDHHDAAVADELRRTGLQVHCTNTIMSSSEEKVALARAALDAASSASNWPAAESA